MGRPVLEDNARRKVQVNIRLTADENKKIIGYARAAGLSPANWIRQKVFSGKFPVIKNSVADAALYRELHRIGVNLNQAVKLVHSGKQNIEMLPIISELLTMEKQLLKILLS